jgi:hypothetical protein
MLHSSPVTFFFQALNVAVLALAGYWMYKKYIKGPLEEKVTQQEAVLKGLAEQGYFLEGKAHDLEEQRAQQDRRAQQLTQKFEDWRYEVDQERFKAQEEGRIFAARSAERIAAKNAFIAQQTWAQKVEPILINEAQKKLQQHYTQARSAEFVHEIITRLKREQQ